MRIPSRPVLLVVAGLALLAWGGRALFFEFAGARWAVDDAPAAADAIVVLGGNFGRAEKAAELFQARLAPVVLVMPDDYGDSRGVLLGRGVPAAAIVTLGEVKSTLDEARAARDWADRHHARRLTVVTDYFHTRRARATFRRNFPAPDFTVRATAVYPPGIDPRSWWRTPDGRRQLWTEFKKTAALWVM